MVSPFSYGQKKGGNQMLEQYSKTLDQVQKRLLESLLAQEGETNVSLSLAGEPAYTAPKLEALLDAKKHQTATGQMVFDLKALYQATIAVGNEIRKSGRLGRAELTSLTRKVEEILKQADEWLLLLAAGGETVARDAGPLWQNVDEAPGPMAVERKGGARLPVVSATDHWRLPTMASANTATSMNGRFASSVKVVRRTGMAHQTQRLPESNMIDGSDGTYWAESVIAEEVLTQEGATDWKRLYPGIPVEGAFAEIELMLAGVTFVSELTVVPFSRYPLEVVSIVGVLESGERVLVAPDKAKSGTSEIHFSFAGERIKGLRLVIRQRHAEERHYWVDTAQMKNEAIWDELASTVMPTSKALDIDGKPKKNEMIIGDWTLYLNRLKSVGKEKKNSTIVKDAEKALKLVAAGDFTLAEALYAQISTDKGVNAEQRLADQWIGHTGLVYSYGIREIRVGGTRYEPRSVAVTKPLPVAPLVQQLVLETDEEHHERGYAIDVVGGIPKTLTRRITNVEWYASAKGAPKEDGWVSILPRNQKRVDQERLLEASRMPVSPYGAGYVFYPLRFKVQGNLEVFMNGLALEPSQYRLCDDRQTVAVKEALYNPTTLFTASYIPTPDAYVLNIASSADAVPHVGTDGSAGERLDQVPVRRSHQLMYAPRKDSMRVFIADEEWTRVERMPNEKEYRIEGAIVTFGAGEGKVRIDYERYATSIRLKAILRRHDGGEAGVTPVVTGYRLFASDTTQEVGNGDNLQSVELAL